MSAATPERTPTLCVRDGERDADSQSSAHYGDHKMQGGRAFTDGQRLLSVELESRAGRGGSSGMKMSRGSGPTPGNCAEPCSKGR